MSSRLILSLVIASLACVLWPLSITAASREGSGHLVVKRAANYGSNLDLLVFIDGQRVARLPWGQSYEGPISAGRHELMISVDGRLRTNPATKHLVVVPGKTYQFTGGI